MASYGQTTNRDFWLQRKFENKSYIKHVFTDETFKSTPLNFDEVYTDHGDFESYLSHNHVNHYSMHLKWQTSHENLRNTLSNIKNSNARFKTNEDFNRFFEAVLKMFLKATVACCWYHFNLWNLWNLGRSFKRSKVTWRIILICHKFPLTATRNWHKTRLELQLFSNAQQTRSIQKITEIHGKYFLNYKQLRRGVALEI